MYGKITYFMRSLFHHSNCVDRSCIIRGFNYVQIYVHSSSQMVHPMVVPFKSISYFLVHVHSSSKMVHPMDVHFKSIWFFNINVHSLYRKVHPMDVHFKSDDDADVNRIFGPKMDVHRTSCAIWVVCRE